MGGLEKQGQSFVVNITLDSTLYQTRLLDLGPVQECMEVVDPRRWMKGMWREKFWCGWSCFPTGFGLFIEEILSQEEECVLRLPKHRCLHAIGS